MQYLTPHILQWLLSNGVLIDFARSWGPTRECSRLPTRILHSMLWWVLIRVFLVKEGGFVDDYPDVVG